MGPRFREKLDRLIASGQVAPESRVCFVDDGSTDGTWPLIRSFAAADPHVEGIALSRNRGHQNALFAGLMEARGFCDVAVSMDCDGQDDIDAIDAMLDEHRAGFDVVYGTRSDRDSDSRFKRGTAHAFYKLMRAMGVEVVYDHADYRLMSARALDGLARFDEVNLFLRGMVPLVGYPSTTVEYHRAPREAGESHYPLKKMLGLAVDGVTSLSVKPIRIVSTVGVALSVLGFIGVLWALVTMLTGNAVAGWASTICIVCFLGGIQLLSLGVIGEYVGKIYLEVKGRPRWIVSDRTWESDLFEDGDGRRG